MVANQASPRTGILTMLAQRAEQRLARVSLLLGRPALRRELRLVLGWLNGSKIGHFARRQRGRQSRWKHAERLSGSSGVWTAAQSQRWLPPGELGVAGGCTSKMAVSTACGARVVQRQRDGHPVEARRDLRGKTCASTHERYAWTARARSAPAPVGCYGAAAQPRCGHAMPAARGSSHAWGWAALPTRYLTGICRSLSARAYGSVWSRGAVHLRAEGVDIGDLSHGQGAAPPPLKPRSGASGLLLGVDSGL